MKRYGLARGVRLVHDPVQQADVLLYPEGLLQLNETAAAIVSLCDGTRTTADITTELSHAYEGVTEQPIAACLAGLAERRVIITADGAAMPLHAETAGGQASGTPRDPCRLGCLRS